MGKASSRPGRTETLSRYGIPGPSGLGWVCSSMGMKPWVQLQHQEKKIDPFLSIASTRANHCLVSMSEFKLSFHPFPLSES
jgi:hypothetical protein